MTLSRKTRQEMHDNALIDTAVSMCFLAAGLVLTASSASVRSAWKGSQRSSHRQ